MRLFLFFMMCSMQVTAQNLDLFEKRELKVSDQETLPYRILFPENYDRVKKYPLVLFLHGVHERGSDNEKQLTHGAKLFLSENARKNFPCIVVFPQCAADGYWSSVKIDVKKKPIEFDFDYRRPSTRQLEDVMVMLKKIIKEESVDKKRIYVTGLSMGGFGTFEIVNRMPKTFAAALPICGGGDAQHFNGQAREVPFWIFHGVKDDIVDIKYSQEMVAMLKKTNLSVRYSEYPEANHNSWDSAFAEPEFLPWMFSNKRK